MAIPRSETGRDFHYLDPAQSLSFPSGTVKHFFAAAPLKINLFPHADSRVFRIARKDETMRRSMLFTGDVNLMNVTDPAGPFARVGAELKGADVLFGNLECCLYQPPAERSLMDEGFYANPDAARALSLAGYHVLGNANNVTYGADAIRSSLRELDGLGIAHTGAGLDRDQARAPAVIERGGMRFGFLQRTSVYWPTNHEAGEHSPGVAVLRGHTAYQLPLHKTRPEIPPANRPGVPPEILTWTDPAYLAQYREDLAALRQQADIVVASHHWGLHEEVLQYMTEIAHAAIEAGADVVIGHGPHYSLPVEVYRGKPVFYGLGNFSFHTGHGGRKHGDWVGMMARVTLDDRRIDQVSFRFVRHNERNETLLRSMKDESEMLAKISERSARFGTRIAAGTDAAIVQLS
jgi:poly-gamma-glutamate synthesis protein (capsule biosynthesis protein)